MGLITFLLLMDLQIKFLLQMEMVTQAGDRHLGLVNGQHLTLTFIITLEMLVLGLPILVKN